MTRDTDTRQRFVIENSNVRGQLVSLDATFRAVLDRHSYPRPVGDLLGETLAASALLSATIKFEGALTLQLQGRGPVPLLVAECTSGRSLRGLARWKGDPPESTDRNWLGPATLALTIAPVRGERYQGIVAVDRGEPARAIENYFARSEQLPTRLWLAAHESRATGLLLQRLPTRAGDPDAWQRAGHLTSTLGQRELLELPGREILRRLFNQEELRVFEPEPVSFRCSCSRDRVARVLIALGPKELRSVLRAKRFVSVRCDFCNHRYAFDPVDVEQLFADPLSPAAPATRQ